MNLTLFRWINGWPDAISPEMKFLSEAANFLWFKILILLLIVAMIWRGGKPRMVAIQALIALGIANGITDIFKNVLPEHRPFQDMTDVVMRAGRTGHPGTASAHAANMASVAFVFTSGLGRWGIPWIFIAALVGLSRIYVGVHYPYQVLLGWLCGITAGLLVTKTWQLIAERRNHVKTVKGE